MNKIVFLHFGELPKQNGITNKIEAQCSAFSTYGYEVHLANTHRDGKKEIFLVNDQIIGEANIWQNTLHVLFCIYWPFYKFVKQIKARNIYYRMGGNAQPGIILMLFLLKLHGCRIIAEIPTYPYDSEKELIKRSLLGKIQVWSDKINRHLLRFVLYLFVTFSDDKKIWGVQCINIANGYIPSRMPIKKRQIYDKKHLHLIAAAIIQSYHGYDRIIEGMREYYQSKSKKDPVVTFTICGNGDLNPLKDLVQKYNLNQYVSFTGNLTGKAFNAEFDKAHFAIGSLGRHRSGLTTMRALKNVEYTSRGLPFIYSENNPDFDGKPFVIKASQDDTPININKIVSFMTDFNMTAEEIHQYALGFSWEEQMKCVVKYFNGNKNINS